MSEAKRSYRMFNAEASLSRDDIIARTCQLNSMSAPGARNPVSAEITPHTLIDASITNIESITGSHVQTDGQLHR